MLYRFQRHMAPSEGDGRDPQRGAAADGVVSGGVDGERQRGVVRVAAGPAGPSTQPLKRVLVVRVILRRRRFLCTLYLPYNIRSPANLSSHAEFSVRRARAMSISAHAATRARQVPFLVSERVYASHFT